MAYKDFSSYINFYSAISAMSFSNVMGHNFLFPLHIHFPKAETSWSHKTICYKVSLKIFVTSMGAELGMHSTLCLLVRSNSPGRKHS